MLLFKTQKEQHCFTIVKQVGKTHTVKANISASLMSTKVGVQYKDRIPDGVQYSSTNVKENTEKRTLTCMYLYVLNYLFLFT